LATLTDGQARQRLSPAPPTTARFAVPIGVAVGLAAVAVYSTQLFQPFDPDGSTTVGWFIHYPGILRVFTTNQAYNNHLLFSFLEKLIYKASGENQGEAILRILPIAASGASVGLLTAAITRYWGALRGIAAGLLLATNVLFVSQASSVVRGYSMIVFFGIASTLVLVRMTRVETPTQRDTIAYVLLVAAGIVTHVFMVPLVILQAGYVLARDRLDVRWIKTFAGAGALGLVFYVFVAKDMITDNGLGRHFWPGFPNDVLHDWLGGTTVAVVIGSILLVMAAITVGWRREWLCVGLPLVGMLVFAWLIWQPFNLGTRFFMWAIPAVAVGVVYATRRYPALLLLVFVMIVSQVWVQVGDWYEPELAHKPAGAIVQRRHDAGKRVCSVGFGGGPLAGYTEPNAYVEIRPEHTEDLKGCDDVVVLVKETIPESMFVALDARYPYKLILPAEENGTIYSKEPIPRRMR
jgi:hypothetical protein